jgi:hypothetical protein
MALISCPECSHQVSELAPTCPSCGFPFAAVTQDGTVALRNCPECSGTGTVTQGCHYCDGVGYTECPYCNKGRIYGDPCPDCGGSNRESCPQCEGRRTESWDCETCNKSGQITLREYEEHVADKQKKEQAARLAVQAKHTEKQRQETEATAQKLASLRERLSEIKGDLLQIGLSQGALILIDSVYAVDRAKIMKTYGDQILELKVLRLECKFCGEPLNWKERLRKLKVHEKQECQEGWERVSKQIAENNVRFEEFVREDSETSEDEE